MQNKVFSWEESITREELKQTQEENSPLLHIQESTKKELKKELSKKTVNEFLSTIPSFGESYHIVSNGNFDYFDLIPRIQQIINLPLELYASTWTMNYTNVQKLLDMFDSGELNSIKFITGEYLRTREPAVYHLLHEGLSARNQNCKSIKNHAKITLLANYDKNIFIVIEGSANFTANPRIEQHVINNDKLLYEFHKNWIDNSFK